MTTTLAANTSTTLSTPASGSSATTPRAEIKSSPTTSMEATISSLAESLMGYASRCVPESTNTPRLFTRIERIVDSIARLVEALATYRSSTSPETSSTTDDSTEPAAAGAAAASAGVDTDPVREEVPTQDPIDTPNSDPISSPPIEDAAIVADSITPPPADIELGAALPPTGGFLWKPISDKNGDLAILLPKQYTGRVKQVRILSPDGTKTIGKGKYSGVGNGDREHFRFPKPGSSYPDGAIVLIEMENGAIRNFKIKDTSRRTER